MSLSGAQHQNFVADYPKTRCWDPWKHVAQTHEITHPGNTLRKSSMRYKDSPKHNGNMLKVSSRHAVGISRHAAAAGTIKKAGGDLQTCCGCLQNTLLVRFRSARIFPKRAAIPSKDAAGIPKTRFGYLQNSLRVSLDPRQVPSKHTADTPQTRCGYLQKSRGEVQNPFWISRMRRMHLGWQEINILRPQLEGCVSTLLTRCRYHPPPKAGRYRGYADVWHAAFLEAFI